MKVVDLADEFGLTTSEAVDACLWAGVAADSSATELSDEDARQVRGLISGWIDAGFVPWRSQGDQHPGATKNRTAAAVAAASTDLPTRGGSRKDGSTTTLEPPTEREEPGSAVAPVVKREEAARAEPESAGDDDDDNDAGPIAPPPVAPRSGPILPPTHGGPTGWMPGGPDAQPRVAPLAIVALALAIASLVIPFITAVLAIVLASVAKDRIANSRGWRRGTKLATAAQIVAGVGMGLWCVLLIGELATLQNKQTDSANYRDIQVDEGTVRYEDVLAGNCVRLPKEGDINSWSVVSCQDAHAAEVFASVQATNAAGLPYPGAQPIQETAKSACREKLPAYLEDQGELNELEVGYTYPSSQTWKVDADRTVWCVAFRKDGTLLGLSLRNPSLAITTTTQPR